MALAFERDWLKLLDRPEGEDYLPDSGTLQSDAEDPLESTGTAWQTPKKIEKPSSSPLSQSIEQYKSVMQQRPKEPKPKWYQNLGAAALAGTAGYVNAGGRVRPIDVSSGVQEIKAPGYKRRLSDWATQVETAEAGVKGEQMKHAAEMQDLQMQTARENAASLKSQRDAMAEDRRAATAARDRAAITAPGVEEIRTPPPLDTEVPSTVPGLPGQKISVAKPQKEYAAEFEVGGKKYGQRKPAEIAAEQQQIAQANWPTITQKMATDLQQPELFGRKVPPNEFNEFVKMTQGSAGKPLHVVKEGNDITGDVTVTGFDPMTMEQKAQVVLKGIAKKRPPSASGGGLVPGASVDDPKIIAREIIEGRQKPVLSGLFRIGPAVRAELGRNRYDQATAERDWVAIQRHLSTLNGPQQERLRQAVGFTYDSLGQVESLYDEWSKLLRAQTGFKVINRGALWASKQLPGEAGKIAANLEASIADLTSELGTVYKGGNASTDESLRLAAENLKSEWNDKTFRDAVKRVRESLQIRKNSISSSVPIGVSPGSPYLPQGAAPPPGGGGQKAMPRSRIPELVDLAKAQGTIVTPAEVEADLKSKGWLIQ